MMSVAATWPGPAWSRSMCAIAAWKSVKTVKSSSAESDASGLTFSAVLKSEGRSDLVRPALETVRPYRGCVLAILASRYK